MNAFYMLLEMRQLSVRVSSIIKALTNSRVLHRRCDALIDNLSKVTKEQEFETCLDELISLNDIAKELVRLNEQIEYDYEQQVESYRKRVNHPQWDPLNAECYEPGWPFE